MDLYAVIDTKSSSCFFNIYSHVCTNWKICSGRREAKAINFTKLWNFFLRLKYNISDRRLSEYRYVLRINFFVAFRITLIKETQHGSLMGIASRIEDNVDVLKSESPCGMGSCLSCQTLLPVGFQKISRFARL